MAAARTLETGAGPGRSVRSRASRRSDTEQRLLDPNQPGMAILLPGILGQAGANLLLAIRKKYEDDVARFPEQASHGDEAFFFQLAHVGGVLREPVLLVRLLGMVPGFGPFHQREERLFHERTPFQLRARKTIALSV